MAKRHHYVPVAYLKRFVDAKGQLLVIRKDAPEQVFRQRPEAAAFEKYYYSQVDEDGTRDDSRFEEIFSTVESRWSMIVEALARRAPKFREAPDIITSIALMRVRGPAFRDPVELHLAYLVRGAMEAVVARGLAPPPPVPIALDDVIVSIDPHRSLMAMIGGLEHMAALLRRLHFDVLHNATAVPFLTSDNPVLFFDAALPRMHIQPYPDADACRRFELLFPLTPTMLLRGRLRPVRQGIVHRTIADPAIVGRANALVARFAYRFVFASAPGQEALVERHAALSPVPRFDDAATGSDGFAFEMMFGDRPDKPRWHPRDDVG